MSGGSISTSATKLEALQIQSSIRGATIPWVRGVTRITGNLLWYGNFRAIPKTETQGGKGGGEVRSTSYSYSANVIIALGHGPFTDVPRVWRGKRLYSGGVVPGQVKTSTETWAVPGSGALTRTLTHGSAFLSIVTVTGMGPDGLVILVPDRDFTVSAAGLVTLLSDEWRGLTLSIRYQWQSGVINRNALDELGLTLNKGHVGQAVWTGLADYPVNALGYSGLANLAAEDYDLGEGAQIENHSFEVVAPLAYSLSETVPDCDPAQALRELVVDDVAGASLPAEHLGTWEAWSTYCIAAGLLVSPRLTEQTRADELLQRAADLTNAAIVSSSGRIELVPYADQPESGLGRTYTPSTTPVYDLNDECWTPTSANMPPLSWRRKSGGDAYNHWRLEYLNRDNNYNTEPVEAKDSADIAQNGLRSNPSTVSAADWICAGSSARKAVQLMMQRSISVLCEYEAALPWHFALLDLMDLVTLTDDDLRMDRHPARVIAIEENEDGDLQVTFEDAPIGAASAPTYAHAPELGFSPDYNASPGSVASVVVFEGPAQTAAPTGIEVFIAARGSNSNWGGCQVWTSLDGTNYRLVDTIRGPSRFGTLASTLAAGATSMQVTGLGDAELRSGSAADAAQLQTLCFVSGTQGEFLAHQGATLTGTGAYTLAGLVRAAYASPNVAHASGSVFVRVDDQVARSGPLEPSLIGQALYIKCCSFNAYGAAVQSLADVVATIYTVTGQPASYQPGIAGKALTLQASALTFQYPRGGGVNPGSITLTAAFKGGLAGTVVWSVVAGTATLTGSGATTRTLTAANLGSDSATIRATVTDSVASYTAEVTIVKVADGASSLVADLSNDTHTLPASATGKVSSYAGAVTTMTIALGPDDDTANWAFTRANSTGVTSSISGNTVTVTALTDAIDAGYVDITATRAGYPTQVKRFGLTKARNAPGVGSGIVPSLRPAYYSEELGFGATATVGHTVRRNGTQTSGAPWWLDGPTDVGDGYYVRLRRLTGVTPSGPALDTWHQLTSDRSWSLSSTNALKTFEGYQDISTAGSDATIVATGVVGMTANSYSGAVP